MIKLYIKKNPNPLAELGQPQGVINREVLLDFFIELCKNKRDCETCELTVCKGDPSRFNINEFFNAAFKENVNELELEIFEDVIVDDAVSVINKSYNYDIEPYLIRKYVRE